MVSDTIDVSIVTISEGFIGKFAFAFALGCPLTATSVPSRDTELGSPSPIESWAVMTVPEELDGLLVVASSSGSSSLASFLAEDSSSVNGGAASQPIE